MRTKERYGKRGFLLIRRLMRSHASARHAARRATPLDQTAGAAEVGYLRDVIVTITHIYRPALVLHYTWSSAEIQTQLMGISPRYKRSPHTAAQGLVSLQVSTAPLRCLCRHGDDYPLRVLDVFFDGRRVVVVVPVFVVRPLPAAAKG